MSYLWSFNFEESRMYRKQHAARALAALAFLAQVSAPAGTQQPIRTVSAVTRAPQTPIMIALQIKPDVQEFHPCSGPIEICRELEVALNERRK